MDSRRQKKLAQLIQEEMGKLLQKEGANYYGNKFVTVTSATISPDLFDCKIFISVFGEPAIGEQAVDGLNRHSGDIRRRFGQIMRNSLRIIPQIQFFLDDTLENVFRLEEIFRQAKEDKKDNPE